MLASDSEPPDQNQLDRLEEVAEENFMRPFMLSARDAEVGWCFCWCSVFCVCVCVLLARRHVGLLDCEIYEVLVCV